MYLLKIIIVNFMLNFIVGDWELVIGYVKRKRGKRLEIRLVYFL